jgi:hypothetical protein
MTSQRRSTPILVVLTAALLFGAFDQWIGAHNNLFWTQVSNGMSSLWLVVPFIAGFSMSNQRGAVLVGLYATWLSVLAYVLMIVSPMEGTHLGPAPTGLHGTWNQLSLNLFVHVLLSQGQWFAFALLVGPVLGLLGFYWRTRRYWVYAFPVALALVLEPPARWIASRVGLADVPWVPFRWPNSALAQKAEILELVVGLVATWMIIRFGASSRGTAPLHS